MTMHTKTTIMLAIASLLTLNAAAMAATKHHHNGVTQSEAVLNARAQYGSSVYDSASGYDPVTLFDRAKGNID
jgi:hypothetical protein